MWAETRVVGRNVWAMSEMNSVEKILFSRNTNSNYIL